MLKIKEYVKAESLEQAYELNQKRTNCILGGMLWLKMSNRNVQKAIDLSGLGLDQIEETEDEFRIGCMTTLRELECHEALNEWSDGAVKDAVSDIVGVQFRNLATIGGSIFGRYGFSDVLTVFLAMDSYVELHKGGIIPLHEFAQMKRDNDILVRVIVKKDQKDFVYLSHRNSKTDFPVLTCAVSVDETEGWISVGARPQKAVRMSMTIQENVAFFEHWRILRIVMVAVGQKAADASGTSGVSSGVPEYEFLRLLILLHRLQLQQGLRPLPDLPSRIRDIFQILLRFLLLLHLLLLLHRIQSSH